MRKYNMTKKQRASVKRGINKTAAFYVDHYSPYKEKPRNVKEPNTYVKYVDDYVSYKEKPRNVKEGDDYLKAYQKQSDSKVLEKFHSKYTPIKDLMPVAISSIVGNIYLQYNEKTDEYDVKSKSVIDYDSIFKTLAYDAAFMLNVPIVFMTDLSKSPVHRVLTMTSWSIDSDRKRGFIIFTGSYINSVGHLVLVKVTFYKYEEQHDITYKEIIINKEATNRAYFINYRKTVEGE